MKRTFRPKVGPVKNSEWSFFRPPEVVAEDLLRGAKTSDVPPTYVEEAKRRADALGIDLHAVLLEDAKRVERFPTSQCVTPTDAEAYWTENTLPAERSVHVRECEFCQRVLAAAKPSEEQLGRFLDELGSFAVRAAVRSRTAGAQVDPRPASSK